MSLDSKNQRKLALECKARRNVCTSSAICLDPYYAQQEKLWRHRRRITHHTKFVISLSSLKLDKRLSSFLDQPKAHKDR